MVRQGKSERQKNAPYTRKQLLVLLKDDYIEGTYRTQHDLALRYGVSDAMICQCLKVIRAILDEEFKEEIVADRNRRVKQLEDVLAKANLAWKRSQQNAEELRIQYVKVKCRECGGTGRLENDTLDCFACEGVGKVTEEVLSKKVMGQAGDPRLLNVVRDCVKEIARLNGHYRDRDRDRDRREELHEHKHLHIGDVTKVDPDILIQMRRLMIQAEESKNGNGMVLEEVKEKKGRSDGDIE